MRIEICRPQELGPTELVLWRQWQQSDRRLRSPFLTPEFATAFGRHNSEARVAVVREGSEITGFLPFQSKSRRLMKSFAYDIADLQALIKARDVDIPLLALMREMRHEHFEFDHLVDTQTRTLDPAHFRLSASPVIDMNCGWDAWITDKRAQQSRIKRLSQRSRQLEKALGPIAFDLDCRSETDLQLLMKWKSEQYMRTGRTDRFKRDWFREFVHELFETRTQDFELQLSRLTADGRTVALGLGPCSRGQVAAWFPTYDRTLSNFSPGALCLLEQVRVGCQSGLDSIDLGKGEGTYKESFKNRDEYVAEGWISAGGPFSLLRRAETAPSRMAYSLVTGDPRLQKAARSTLKFLGGARSKVSSSG